MEGAKTSSPGELSPTSPGTGGHAAGDGPSARGQGGFRIPAGSSPGLRELLAGPGQTSGAQGAVTQSRQGKRRQARRRPGPGPRRAAPRRDARRKRRVASESCVITGSRRVRSTGLRPEGRGQAEGRAHALGGSPGGPTAPAQSCPLGKPPMGSRGPPLTTQAPPPGDPPPRSYHRPRLGTPGLRDEGPAWGPRAAGRHEADAKDGPVPGQGLGAAQRAEAQLLGQPSHGREYYLRHLHVAVPRKLSPPRPQNRCPGHCFHPRCLQISICREMPSLEVITLRYLTPA
ncbi:translation initiation factor IF-2 isoform X3 [Heterocephalus glaber]|uniref:Translation initiation factor IF-2 isoform X3 n=1 Tax=Heterocephalus glaber TaxID=10181 RepID=A0AAX6SSE4_HETGA|nr:translation initiation factor IF-2 isoform X3 [Heterocephalus glaber]